MAAPPGIDDIRFVFDEDSRGFGLWLSKLRKDMTCVGHAPVDVLLPLGTLDPDWIPVVAGRGWVAITKNAHIRTQPQEAALAVEHGLRVACLIEPLRNANRWDFAQMVFKHWDAIAGLAGENGPVWLNIYRDRVKVLEFRPGEPPRARDGRL